MNLPETWVETRLGDICQIGSGDGAPQEEHWFQESGEPFIRVSDLATQRDSIRITTSRDQLTSEAVEKLRIRKWRKDSLLLPKSGASALLNQRALLGIDACVVSHLAILEPTGLIDADFLYWWSTKFDAARVIPDPSYPSIRLQDLARVKIALPTLPEQLRIVDVLQQAEVVAKAKRSISYQVDHLIRTAYWEHFADWFTADGLIDPVRISDYVSDSQYGVSEAMGETGTHAVLRMNSMTTSGWLDLTDLKYANLSKKDIESTELRDGDLLFNRTNSKELVGKCAIWRPVEGAFSFASYLIRLRLKPEMLPEFLWATLNSAYGKYRLLNSAKQAVSMANISPTNLGRITVPLPPLPLQHKFAALVREIEALRAQMLGKLEMYSELQEIISQQTFVGQLTEQWREAHSDEIGEAAKDRDALLRKSGTKVSLAGAAKVSFTARGDLTARPARHWLLAELSEFQCQVLTAFTEYCQQSGQPLLVEDAEVFARFCDDPTVTERLQAFGQSHGNRIRRSLSQLASLGLIAKITLPKQDLESGELDYLKAFRPLRPEEFTRMADVQSLRKSLSSGVDQQSYYFHVQLDYETSERAGAGGMFQVISIEDEHGKNFTHLVDQGKHYASLDELKKDIASALKVEMRQVDLEAV